MTGLIFITHQTAKYSYLESAEIALNGGCKHVQLRMKNASISEVEKTAKAMKTMCDAHNAHLYIDDYVEICKTVQASGVHLGKMDMSPTQARQTLGNDFIIGGTANTFEDMVNLQQAGVNYIGLGPFRFTETKKNLSPILGLEGYIEIMRKLKEENILLPIFAIGGITMNDISELMKTGIAGIAMSGTILQAANPVETTKNICTIIQKQQ